jgi:hypothetical protein
MKLKEFRWNLCPIGFALRIDGIHGRDAALRRPRTATNLCLQTRELRFTLAYASVDGAARRPYHGRMKPLTSILSPCTRGEADGPLYQKNPRYPAGNLRSKRLVIHEMSWR